MKNTLQGVFYMYIGQRPISIEIQLALFAKSFVFIQMSTTTQTRTLSRKVSNWTSFLCRTGRPLKRLHWAEYNNLRGGEPECKGL